MSDIDTKDGLELETIVSNTDHDQRNDRVKEDLDESDENQKLWGSRAEFFLTCIGWSTDITVILSFPYMFFRGGIGFLLIYFILTVLVAMPMYYMQLCLGQFTGKGPVGAWDIFPIGRGVGVAQFFYGVATIIYFNVIMGYNLHYLFASFRATLPWSICPENDYLCFEGSYEKQNSPYGICRGRYDNHTAASNYKKPENCFTPSESHWRSSVLGIDKATLTDAKDLDDKTFEALSYFGDIGGVKWDHAFCLLLSWIIMFLCIFKDPKSSGKVIYFIVPTIYGIIAILFIYSCTLEGSSGLYMMLTRFDSVLDISMWKNAMSNILYGHGLSMGVITMLGSHNKRKDKVSKCLAAIIIPIINFITSIICSVIMLNFFDFLAFNNDVNLHSIIGGGTRFMFITMSEILSLLPIPQLWSILFFSLFFLICLCQAFPLLQTILGCIHDGISNIQKYSFWVTLSLCSFCFLLGLLFVTSAGYYILILLDFNLTIPFIIIAILEASFILGIFLRPLLCGSRSVGKSFIAFLIPDQLAIKIVWSFLTVIILLIFTSYFLHHLYEKRFDYIITDGRNLIRISQWSKILMTFLTVIPIASIPLLWANISTLWYIISPKKSWLDLVWPDHRWKPFDSQTQIVKTVSSIPKIEMNTTIPVIMDCPSCQVTAVLTVTESEPTVQACAWGYCLLIYFQPLCCLPFCLCQRFRHRCPHCGVIIGQNQ